MIQGCKPLPPSPPRMVPAPPCGIGWVRACLVHTQISVCIYITTTAVDQYAPESSPDTLEASKCNEIQGFFNGFEIALGAP